MNTYRAYFTGVDSAGLQQLFVTDGSAFNTHEIPLAGDPAIGIAPLGLTSFGSAILFEGADAAGNFNLFISNGAASGATELTSPGASSYGLFGLEQEGPHGSTIIDAYVPQRFTRLGQTAVFTAVDASNHLQLWATNGKPGGTAEIAVANAYAYGLQPSSITALGAKALFSGTDATGNAGLWITDGTASGTTELLAGTQQASDPSSITAIAGGRAVFTETAASGAQTLWVTDGTAAGTKPLAVTGLATTGPDDFIPAITAFGNGALFAAFDTSGREDLWFTDGASTREILPGGASAAGVLSLYESSIGQSVVTAPVFAALGSKMLFEGFSADGSYQLWITDGTASGTAPLTTAAEGHYDLGNVSAPAMIGGSAVFNYVGLSGTSELWVTDGTAAGTKFIDLTQTANPRGPQNFTTVGNEVVFSAYNPAGQNELWATNGTDGGTAQMTIPQASASGLAPTGFLEQTTIVPLNNVYGSLGGGSLIEGTAADDYIHAYGLGNTIYTNGGDDFINAGAGQATVYVAAQPFVSVYNSARNFGPGATVNLQGAGNTVYGESGNYTIVGGTGDNTVQVGFGNDVISLFGAGNQVILGSGTSTVRFTGGSSSVLLTDFGEEPAPYLYDLTLIFAGTNNALYNYAATPGHTVIGDRGALKLTGGDGGGNFDLAWSYATLVTGGTDNIVDAGQGVSDITPGSGSDTVNLEASLEFFQRGGDVTIHLAGQHDLVRGVAHTLTVTGGNGYGVFNLVGDPNSYSYYTPSDVFAFYQRTYAVTTGGSNNNFTLDGANSNTVFTGYGNASVTITDPPPALGAPLQASSIAFRYTNNTMVAGNASVTATGGSGDSSYTLGDGDDTVVTAGLSNVVSAGNGNDTLAPGGGLAVVTAGNGNDAITISGAYDTVVAGNGADTLTGSASLSHVTLGDGADTILLTGAGNSLHLGNGADTITFVANNAVLVAGDGNDTVTGGTGVNSVTVGAGHNTVQLGGWGNSITAGAGADTLDGGLGFTTATLNGSDATLLLRGRGDSATLNAGAHATITDTSSNLHLVVSASDVQAAVAGFGAGSGAVLSLANGAGGYTSVQQVLGALRGDGHGGTLLSLGAAGWVDFTSVAPAALHAVNFQV